MAVPLPIRLRCKEREKTDRLGGIAPNLSVFHVLIKSDAAAAATPTQNQKMFKIGAVYVVRSLHTHFEPNQTILAMFCSQPAKSPHLSTPPLRCLIA